MLKALKKLFFKQSFPAHVSSQDLQQALSLLVENAGNHNLESYINENLEPNSKEILLKTPSATYWLAPCYQNFSNLVEKTILPPKALKALMQWVYAVELSAEQSQQAMIDHCNDDPVLQQQATYRWNMLKQLLQIHLNSHANKVS